MTTNPDVDTLFKEVEDKLNDATKMLYHIRRHTDYNNELAQNQVKRANTEILIAQKKGQSYTVLDELHRNKYNAYKNVAKVLYDGRNSVKIASDTVDGLKYTWTMMDKLTKVLIQ
jgi:CTP-dependent riboflavin kinase